MWSKMSTTEKEKKLRRKLKKRKKLKKEETKKKRKKIKCIKAISRPFTNFYRSFLLLIALQVMQAVTGWRGGQSYSFTRT